MKKVIFVLLWVLCFQFSGAQRSSQFVSPDRLYYEGLSMFKDKNYAGCIDKITDYKKLTQNQDLLQESDYLLVASSYYQGKETAGYELRDYLDTYPQTHHRNTISFMLGSVYFTENDYKMAEYWFRQTDIDYLSSSEQDDYAYRMGIVNLQNDKDTEAFRLFSLLNQYSEKYRGASEYYLAYLNYKEGNYDKALSQFSQLRNNSEFQPEVLYYITQIHFVQKKYHQAIQDGLKLIQQHPDHPYNPEMSRIVGIGYYFENNYPLAVQYLTSFIDSDEAVASKDYYILGLSHYNLNNYPQAINYLSKSNPDNTVFGQSSYLYLGQAYLKTGDTRNALLAFESASRMDSDPAAKEAAMYNYAMLLHQNSVSAFGESVTVLENFVNTYPQSTYADKVNDALVDVYLTTKNYETALNSIAKIKNPGRKIQEAKQKIYYHLGTVEFTNNNYNQSINYFTRAIEGGNYANNEREQAIYWRGESYYHQENYNAAAKDYRSFIQTNNRSGGLSNRANYNLGYCAFKQADYPAAEKYFNTFINQEKNDKKTLADAYARLGDCYFNNRHFSEAERAYNQAVSLVPEMSDYALFQKGYVMGLQKDYKGKINQMDKLIREYPNSPYITDAIYEKGRALVLSNNHTAAIETYQNLLSRYPNSNLARKAGLQIGLLYYNTNQPEKSAAAYKNIIAKYPGSAEAKVAIQDLKSVYFDMNDIGGYANYVNSLGGAVKFEASEQDSLTFLAAERFFLKGDIQQAQNALKNYLQSFPNGAFNTNAHYYLANTYYNQKNFTAAKNEYQKVLEAGNTQFTEEAVGRTAELQYNDKEYEAALQSYERLQSIAESKANRDAGSLGMIRSGIHLNKYNSIIQAATTLLKDESLNPEIASEARYYRAQAYNSLDEKSLAKDDWTVLSKDTRTAFGAEAKYLLANYYFAEGNASQAKSIVQDYIKQGTPHAYWLAKSFILLSDIFASEGDNLQARQYLESLQTNYKNTNDDIHGIINERLSKLNVQ
ncbi:MAG: tetratricopeptide repeat protein [Bacteroidales bacterium]|nr:tetratricopeptide repeat protein [Bacteroidales bacterium]